MRAFEGRVDHVDASPPLVVRPPSLRGLHRYLARISWETTGATERAELLVSVVRAFAVLEAMRADALHTEAPLTLESVLAAASGCLRDVQQRQHELSDPE